MIPEMVRSLFHESAVEEPPRRVWRDYVLVAGLVPTAIVEAVVREQRPWTPVTAALVAGLAFTLLWRRTHPLAMVAITFGSVLVLDIVALIADVDWEILNTAVFFLLLPYSLFRWASGRHATVGLVVMFATASMAVFDDTQGIGDVIGGYVILLVCAELGVVVRSQEQARRQGIEDAKVREREALARELHDSVAHHVSAIAVQAQAGRTLARDRPDAAVDALETIEEAASRTLAEMRSIVGALRRDGEVELAPQPGIADIPRLGEGRPGGTPVAFQIDPDVDDVEPTVDAAVYRLAQESITNAVRHARRARRIEVCVAGDGDDVVLTVQDDGEPRAPSDSGYGIVGMVERAELLGGSLIAGPGEPRGWRVEARLPRTGGAS